MDGSIALWVISGVGIILAGMTVLWILIASLSKKLSMFMQGKNAQSLEETIKVLIERQGAHDECLSIHKEALEAIDTRVKKRLQTPPLLRFNALRDLGTEQSFATAFVDEEGDGYILSAITHRNHIGLYTKKLSKFVPERTLTDEETILLKEITPLI